MAGYTIVFGTGHEAEIYKNSKFYTLKEAYDDALLTKEDIYNIGKQVGIDFIEKTQAIVLTGTDRSS